MPKNMAADTIDFPTYLQLAIDFFSGPELVQQARKAGRKVAALTFPFPELILGGGAVPVFIPRLNKGRRYNIIKAAISARDLIGTGAISRGLDVLKRFDTSGTVLKVAGNVINDIILSLNETYEDSVKLGVEDGMPNDHCYGAKALFGLYKKLGHLVDFNFGLDVKCSVFFAYHEALSIKQHVPRNFIVDMPYTDTKAAVDFYEEELWKYIQFQEEITGKKFDMDRFGKVLEDSNRVKALMREAFLDIARGDILPCSPATFSELQSLLVYSNIDYNSGLKSYVKNLEALVQEMHDRIDRPAKRFDATGHPKIIYTPMFGGFEPEIATYADEMGARIYYPDWIIYGACKPVKTRGNLVRNYAENLLEFQRGFGFSNEQMARNIIEVANKIDADGLVFNEVFGCRSMCTGHRLLRDKIRNEGVDLPMVVITFESMGNSLEAVKTRFNAFVEMIKSG